jgi:hypothetical protein
MFQRVVLILALAVSAGLAIAPPWEGFRPSGGGNFSRDPEPIGHYPVFSPPRPREKTEHSDVPSFEELGRRLGVEPPSKSAKGSPGEQVDFADVRAFFGVGAPSVLEGGEAWRGIRVAWVRVGCEFAALVFITLLLLVMGQLFRGNETHPSKPAEGA